MTLGGELEHQAKASYVVAQHRRRELFSSSLVYTWQLGRDHSD